MDRKPELISCTAKQPPKKDHGQSPLQAAIKSGHLEIAWYLLDRGADINFMENESCYTWRMPVLHDAIMAAVMSSRRNTNNPVMGFQEFNSKEKADAAFHVLKRNVLKRMIEMGADIHARDSYGNSCLTRAVADASQILPTYYWREDRTLEDRVVTDALREDLSRIFHLLLEHGADVWEISNISDKPLIETYAREPVGQFLRADPESTITIR